MAHSSDSSPTEQPQSSDPGMVAKLRNFVVVGVAVLLSVLVVLGINTQTPAASLETLAAEAIPLETALANDKPSFMEFYANWCTSCQAMAGDMADLRSTYGENVNFVMLNVDNTKWLPEMLHYRVDGIPHFVYLDATGEPLVTAIGEQPKAVIASNLEALIMGDELPYQQRVGQTSSLESVIPNDDTARDRSDNPRSHGAQASQ